MARALLNTLTTLNVVVRVESDKLKWKAPKGLMSNSLKAQMKNHKAELLALLRDKKADVYHQGCELTSLKEEQHQVDSKLEDANKELPLNTIILGDCLEKLKAIPDNSIDLIVTDPPYGIKFMGKKWDKAIPSINIWKECLRVLKLGAFAFIMSAPRQDQLSRIIMNLEDAGFNTGFSSMYWTYASGFPKARNIGKAIDKKLGAERKKMGRNPNSRENSDKSNTIYESGTVGKTAYHTGPATEEAKKLDGSYAGFQPKPAVEVIIVAMKPCDKKTYADQALSNGKGITLLDDCRIPYKNDDDRAFVEAKQSKNPTGNKGYFVKGVATFNNKGRFPANLLVSDDVLNDGKEHKSPKQYKKKHAGFRTPYVGGKERIPELQSKEYGDSGGYSRFFSLDAWTERNLPFLLVPKASKKEKDAGLVDFKEKPIKGRDQSQGSRNVAFKVRPTPRKNSHPTVKPIKLMAYLITMGSRENDIVLDPFAGSGTTCIAAKILNRRYIGIELSPEYHEIAVRRLENTDKDNAIKKSIHETFKKVKDFKSENNKNSQNKQILTKGNVFIHVPKRRLDDMPA
jgi:site-specific DNA-methyltransferase (adenine-specific)